MSSFNENENLNNEQTAHTEPSVSTVEPSTDIHSSFAGDQLVTGAEPPKKKRVFPIIAAAVVVLGAGAAAAYNFIPWVKNNARMLLSKPESYYSWVEEQNLAKTAEDISSAYGDMLGADSPTSQEIEVKADLDSENVLMLIESSAGTSVSDLGIKLPSSIAIKSSAAVNDGNTNATCTITADDKSLITSNVSIQDGIYYVKIPELSDAYISLDTAEIMNEAVAELDSKEAAFMMQNYMETVTSMATDPNALKELISEDELHDMIVNYLTVIYENVDDVELEKGVSCEVNGVKTEYNKLSAEISGKDTYKMIKDVLKEAKKDNTIIKLVEKFGGSKDEYKLAIDELITDLSEMEADDEEIDEEIIMNVFVDSKGKICGRSFEITDSDSETATFGYMTAEENEDTAFDVTFDINGESGIEILGKDENKGGKSSGEIKLIINNIDDKNYEIPVRYTDIEKTNENKGYCKGNITIDLSSFGIPSINLALDSDGKSQTVKSDIAIAGTNYATISVILREENTVDIPTFDSSQKVYKITNDGAELEQYITEASLNVTALIDNVGSVFGVNGLGQLIMGFAPTDDQTSVSDPVFTPDVTTDDQILDNPNNKANITCDFSKLNIQLNGQTITLPAKINGLLSYVTVEDQQLEANGFASYFSDNYSLGVNITNDSDAPAAPADCTVTGITVSEGSTVTFSIDGLTIGSSISDVAAKYGVPVPTEEYGSITVYDTNSDWNDFTFYYYNGIVNSVSFDIFDY